MNERNVAATTVLIAHEYEDQYNRSVYVDIDLIAHRRNLSIIDEYTIRFNFTY